MHVPSILEALLEATADKARAEARIAGYRGRLTEEAARRYAEEGAAPTWKRRDVGSVRYDEPGDWSAIVVDEDAFGSFVAQHHPTEAVGILEVPADVLEEAIDALRFVGVPVESRVEARSNFRTALLERCAVDVEETPGEEGEVDRTITVVDPTTGQLVPGTSATRSAPKLVVTLDRDLKARVLEEAKAAAAAQLAEQDEPVTLDEAGERLIAEATAAGLPLTTAAELSPAERATVDRFDAAPDALVADNIEALREALGTSTPTGHRLPYVGTGADGARRSAAIDLTEVDGLDRDDPRRDELLASADRWNAQAVELAEAEEGTVIEHHGNGALAIVPERETVASVQPDRAPEASSSTDREAEVSAIVALDNREALRRIARTRGVSTGGATKRELAEALHADGFRA